LLFEFYLLSCFRKINIIRKLAHRYTPPFNDGEIPH